MARKSSVKISDKRKKQKIIGCLLALLLIAAAGIVYVKKAEFAIRWHRMFESLSLSTVEKDPIPDPERWRLLRQDLQRWRVHYAAAYRSAATGEEKHKVLEDARALLENTMPEMMRCWLGTPWDFNGIATEPGKGKIACGYFVSTVMEGAEFQVSRTQLAQQASQNILRTFLKQNDLRLRVGVPYKTFCQEMMRCESGIYIIGLDTHIGFLIVKNQSLIFLHSSGSKPWCVVEESGEQAHVLEKSNYRVMGNITGSDDVLRRWLLGDAFATFYQ